MKSFGSLPRDFSLCVLHSGDDEFATSLNKEQQIKRWTQIAQKGPGRIHEKYSGVIEGASHSLAKSSEAIVQNLVDRVLAFLKDIS